MFLFALLELLDGVRAFPVSKKGNLRTKAIERERGNPNEPGGTVHVHWSVILSIFRLNIPVAQLSLYQFLPVLVDRLILS